MDISSPPITAIASGCSICDPAPSAKASGNMPQMAADCGHHDRPQPPLCRVQHCLARRRALGAIVLVRIQQQDAVLGHDADDHDEAHERRHVEVVRVISSAKITPEMESTDEVRIAIGAAKLRNSASSTPKTSASASSSTRSSSWNDFCCSSIGAAVFHAHRRRQLQLLDSLLHLLDGGAQVGSFQPPGDDNKRCRFSRRISFCGGNC